MNEATFLLAILVNKKIINEKEAHKLRKEMAQGTLNTDLNTMLQKVDNAFATPDKVLQTIDAKDILG